MSRALSAVRAAQSSAMEATWTLLSVPGAPAPHPGPRSSHGVSALPDGTVLVLGGEREARDPAGMDLWQLKPTEGYAQQSATLAIDCREGFASLGAPSGTCTRNGRRVPHTARQRLRRGGGAREKVSRASFGVRCVPSQNKFAPPRGSLRSLKLTLLPRLTLSHSLPYSPDRHSRTFRL